MLRVIGAENVGSYPTSFTKLFQLTHKVCGQTVNLFEFGSIPKAGANLASEGKPEASPKGWIQLTLESGVDSVYDYLGQHSLQSSLQRKSISRTSCASSP